MTDNRVTDLIERIRAVFPLSGIPDADEIVSHSCLECSEVRDFLKGKEWIKVDCNPNTELRSYRTATGLLTPKAFHYYLPVWLLACLQFPEYCDIIPDYIARELNKETHQHEETLKHFNARMHLFSNDQLCVIHSVLQYFAERYSQFGYPADIAAAVVSVEAWINKFK